MNLVELKIASASACESVEFIASVNSALRASIEYIAASVDPLDPKHELNNRLLSRCFGKAKKNMAAYDFEIEYQDFEDAKQEGFLYAWSELTEATDGYMHEYEWSRFIKILDFDTPEQYARFLLVTGCSRAIRAGAYYSMANRARLVDLDSIVGEDGTTLAEILAAPEYNDLDPEYLITHCEFEFGLQPQDATKIRTIAAAVNTTGKLSNKNKQVLKRLKAKYRVK